MELRTCPPDGRALTDIAIGGLAPIVVGAALVAVRGHVASVNVVLTLAVVVVASGALGGRTAGMVSAVTAALSYDFFHTRPYLSLLIHDTDDVVMTALLLTVGLISGQLGWWARRADRRAAGGRGELDRIRRLADQVARGFETADVIMAAQAELTGLLGLIQCRFEAVPFIERLDLPRLERNGLIDRMRYRMQPGGSLELELPAEGLAVPVLARGQIVGRFVLEFEPGATASLEQRVVALALADQVGASLATYPPPLAIR